MLSEVSDCVSLEEVSLFSMESILRSDISDKSFCSERNVLIEVLGADVDEQTPCE